MGVLYFGIKKEYLTAIKYFTEAINKDSSYYQSYYGRGSCYEAIGDKKKALIDYQTALKINKEYTPVIESLKSLSSK